MRNIRPLALLAGAALALGPALPAAASHDVATDRVGGQTRYGTAAELAHDQYPDGADEVIVASGERYPDALAGAPLAAALDAPVLLTERDHLPDVTLAALDELAPSHVTLLGGEAAISAQVEATIAQSVRVQTDRVEGPTRYATAADLARAVQDRTGDTANFPGGQRAAFLVTGQGFPDALAAGAPAAGSDTAPIPMLLTERDRLPDPTAEAIADLELDLVIIVGGRAAVSADVARAVEDQDTTVDRVAGRTRTDTATAVADFAREYLGFDAADLQLTRGDAFPDALAVAARAGAQHDPILLTHDRDTLSPPTADWLARQCAAVERIRAIGGTTALSRDVVADAENVAEDCHAETDQTFLVSPQERLTPQVGDGVEFEVARRADTGGALQSALDVALLPCDTLEEPQDGEFRFRDADDDGTADGIGSSDTGAAAITVVNGTATADGRAHVEDVQPGGDRPGIQVTLDAEAADCAVVLFFADADDDQQLDVDATGLPTEDWGFGLSEWGG